MSTRESCSRPGHGVVEFLHRGVNQDGVVVCRALRSALILTEAAARARDGAIEVPAVGANHIRESQELR